MTKLLPILFVLLVPFSSFAAEQQILSDPGLSDPGPTPKSYLAPDIFFMRAHACQSASFTCGPDNVVSNPFGLLFQIFLPIGQSYIRHSIITDIEGNVVALSTFSGFISSGATTFTTSPFTLPSGGASAGLYKFIQIVIGADGRIAISDPYRFRVFP